MAGEQAKVMAESHWAAMQTRIFNYLEANDVHLVDLTEEQDRAFKKQHRTASPLLESSKSKQESRLLARRKTSLLIRPLSVEYE